MEKHNILVLLDELILNIKNSKVSLDFLLGDALNASAEELNDALNWNMVNYPNIEKQKAAKKRLLDLLNYMEEVEESVNTNSVKVDISYYSCVESNMKRGAYGAIFRGSQESGIIAFDIDVWTSTNRVYPFAYGSTAAGVPLILIDEGKDGDDSAPFATISFPEYVGWRVFCVTGGKTLTICIVKDD